MDKEALEKCALALNDADAESSMWELNYDGAMSDLDAALDMLSALINGRTTPERAKDWMRLNYPKRSERDE